MSPNQPLTVEQLETLHELQKELDEIGVREDIAYAKAFHTNDDDCWDEAHALNSERLMKGLIAYIPKAGERKVSKVRKLVAKIKGTDGERCDGCDLGIDEARLGALESVNSWRETYGLPPLDRLPRGVPGDSHECVFARAFKDSAEELGWTSIGVNVAGGGDMTLEAYDADGRWVSDRPAYKEGVQFSQQYANDLINEFDSNAWLDLIEDHSLIHYAHGIAAGDVDGYEELDKRIDRLQEISDEMVARDFPSKEGSHMGPVQPISFEWDSGGGYYDEDDEWVARDQDTFSLFIGKDQEPVRAQFDRELAEHKSKETAGS